jgi:hypothetical protein
MIKVFAVVALLSSCALPTEPKPESKEWNNKYDPEDWRAQFNECRDKFYTAYPDEIIETDWHKCMRKDYSKE